MSSVVNAHSLRALLPAACIWLSALAAVWIDDHYHQVDTHRNDYFWLLVLAIAGFGEALLRTVFRRHAAGVGERYAILAFALWIWIVPFGGSSAPRPWIQGVLAIVLWAALWGLSFVAPALPVRFRRTRLLAAMVVGCALFVGWPLLAASSFMAAVHWPLPHVAAQRSSTGDAPSATLLLLFDELNARAAGPIVQALRDEGLFVSHKALEPVGDRTGHVIPAMLTRGNFSQAKACGLSTICSGNEALDFSQVTVNRSDVDVVGFYHPYCAMQGLRYCRREGLVSAYMDGSRIICALRRRLGDAAPAGCRSLQDLGWTTLPREVDRDYWLAPIWRQGGVMYAHLPYPHPPGQAPGGTLVSHYAEGVARAAVLVRDSVRRLRQNGITDIRVAVVSDHPLRIPVWCGNGTYDTRQCLGADSLQDSQVPLVVGSSAGAVPLDTYRSNVQFFDLLAAPGFGAETGRAQGTSTSLIQR